MRERRSDERDLRVIRDMGWPQEDVEKILGGNLLRLLGKVPGEAATVGGDPNPAKK